MALFKTRGRHLVLTDTGLTLQQREAGALDEISEAVKAVQSSAKQTPDNGLSVTVRTSFVMSSFWLAPESHIRAHQEVGIRLAYGIKMVGILCSTKLALPWTVSSAAQAVVTSPIRTKVAKARVLADLLL
ncbi:MAG: hypothetical protein ACN6P1_03185 [Pseudomonas sp.]|uniref:hypothetical protein n=1 Tax=Pseudomonas sp. TaxID=306 RepID=UPI003D12587A